MATIEANITVNLPDGVDPQVILTNIQHILSGINGLKTNISVQEIDNPVSISPISFSNLEL